MYDRMGVKKGALKGIREYGLSKMGEDLKSLGAEESESEELPELDEEKLKAMGDEGPDETVAVLDVDLPAEEGVAGESDVSLDDIPPELIEKLLAELGD